MLFYWFIGLPRWFNHDASPDLAYVAASLAPSLLIYAMLLPVILFWHSWDFLQRDASVGRWGQRFSSYRSFLTVILAAMVLSLLMETGLFTIDSCDAMEGVFHFECFIQEPYWLLYPFWAAMCVALSLCLAKAIVSISSHLVRAA